MAIKRVTCAALCRIQNDTQHFLLALNAFRLRKGIHVLMPLGGALQYNLPTLLDRFGATPENPEEMELRLLMDEATFPEFQTWFYQRIEREISPLRELQEELVDEIGVLSSLPSEAVRFALSRTQEMERVSERGGVGGMLTRYWNEIYVVTFAPDVMQVLTHAPRETGLSWVTQDEIISGFTTDGVRVDAAILL
jgi:SMODS-associated NUDIX domain